MHQIILFAGTVFMGFFAIMNPFANTPVFVALTKNQDDEAVKRKIALKAVFVAFVIVTIFCIAGQLIFKLFGITLPAFQITGGILLFVVGMHMLNGRNSSVQHPSTGSHKREVQKKVENADEDVAISPLAMPILAGPGTISTAMNFVGASTKMNPVVHIATVVAIFAIMCLISFIFFVSAEKLVAFVGKGMINIISRIMGLILAVISVQMLIAGLNNALHMYYNI